MKFFKYLFLLYFALFFVKSHSALKKDANFWNPNVGAFKDTALSKDAALKPEEQEELKNFAGQLIDMLTDPNDKSMTPQKRQELIDSTVQQTIQYDNYLKNLPEKDRLAEEKKIEEAVTYLMGKEGPFGDAFGPQVDEFDYDYGPEEVVPEEVKEVLPPKKEVVLTSDVTDLKNILENITSRISSLLIKVKSMPRVSSDKNMESAWCKLRLPLTILESLFRIISHDDKLLSVLNNKEYKEIKDFIINLESTLNKFERKFTVADTAGSTIIYDEEEENIELVKSQKQLELIINQLYPILSQKIIQALKDFIQKNAPEVLKQNPELAKNFDNFAKSDFTFPIGRSGSVPFFPKASTGFPGGYDGYSYGTPAVSPSSPGGLATDSTGFDDSKGSGAGLDKKSGEKPKDDKRKEFKKDDKSKPETDSKDRDESSSKEEKVSIDNQINNLKKELEKVSESLKRTDIYDVVRKLRHKDKKDNTVDIIEFQKNYKVLLDNYKNAIEAANKIEKSIKSLDDKDDKVKKEKANYEDAVRKAYKKKDLNLDTELEQVKMAIKVIDETNLAKDNITKIKEIPKKHKELLGAVGLKDIDLLNELKSASKKLTDSLPQLKVVDIDDKLAKQDEDEQVETLNFLDRQIKKLNETLNSILDLVNKIDERIDSFRKNDPRDQYKNAIKKTIDPFIKQLDKLYKRLNEELKEIENLDKDKIEKMNSLIDKYAKIKRLLKVAQEDEEEEEENDDEDEEADNNNIKLDKKVKLQKDEKLKV